MRIQNSSKRARTPLKSAKLNGFIISFDNFTDRILNRHCYENQPFSENPYLGQCPYKERLTSYSERRPNYDVFSMGFLTAAANKSCWKVMIGLGDGHCLFEKTAVYPGPVTITFK